MKLASKFQVWDFHNFKNQTSKLSLELFFSPQTSISESNKINNLRIVEVWGSLNCKIKFGKLYNLGTARLLVIFSSWGGRAHTYSMGNAYAFPTVVSRSPARIHNQLPKHPKSIFSTLITGGANDE